MSSSTLDQSMASLPPRDRPDSWRPVAAGAILLLLLIALFWDFFWRQVRWAVTEQADWGHTLVIPLIACWLVWLRRREICAQGFRICWPGLVAVVAGMAWYNLCVFGPQTLHHHNLRAAGVAMTLGGLVLLFTGFRAMRLLIFPLIYLFLFGQTISERLLQIVTFRLQDITAFGAHMLLVIAGVDVELAGNTITVYRGGEPIPLNIAEACSGMRMLMAFLALGTAMAYVGLPHTWQRIIIVLLGIPISIFVNILRVITLGMLAMIDAGLAAGDFHSFIGLVWLVPAFLLFLGAMWVVRHLVKDPVDPPGVDHEGPPLSDIIRALPPRSGLAFVLAVIVLATGTVGLRAAVATLNLYMTKLPVPMRQHFDNIPQVVGNWTAITDTPRLPPELIEELGTDLYFDRVYANESLGRDAVVNVHLTYYTGMIDAVPHVPDRCMVSGGMRIRSLPHNVPLQVDTSAWESDTQRLKPDGEPYQFLRLRHAITGRPEVVRMPEGDFSLRVTEFAEDARPDMRVFAGYFFIANNRMTPSPEGVRRLAFRLDQKYAYYCKIQFTSSGDARFSEERFLALASDLLASLLPELMRSLPDWSDIESASASAAAVRTSERHQ